MAKIPFNHNIDEKVIETFDRTCEALGPPKYRVLEAAIEVFSILPFEYQLTLTSSNDKERRFYLDLIRALGIPSKSPPVGTKRKSSKSG